ncbi:MAG: cytochrome c oxidase subunit 3 [Paracoccaceae bacterium]|nr:cytochrome c oxidase subunit 3 [Paracoccaceae bacterium]
MTTEVLKPSRGYALIAENDVHHHDHGEKALSGFWLFMMSDLIIFGLFFATYLTTLNKMAIAGGPTPHDLFELKGAAMETAFLLASSFTFGLSSLAMKYDLGKSKVVGWLVVTLLLGFGFLFFEVSEFSRMFAEGAVPQRSGFLSAFFGLVPLHGAHVTAGCLWLIVMLVQIGVFGLTDAVKSRLMRLALFWHFLDVIWIGIFSAVYLAGVAQ